MLYVSIDKWKLSPILIHDEDNILDSRKITLEGWGKTFTLLATASVRATNETKVVSISRLIKIQKFSLYIHVLHAVREIDNNHVI